MIKEKKQIIFLEPWPTPMIAKIAKLFKKNGYRTVSVRILEHKFLSDEFFRECFDEVISFNLVFYKMNIKSVPLIFFSAIRKSKDFFKAVRTASKLRPYVIFCRTSPNWLCALTKILFKKYPLIYFPYDIKSQGDHRLPQYSGGSGKGYNIIASGKIIEEKLPKFEIKAERFCFEKADGIIHKGAPDELKHLNKKVLGDNLKICPLQLQFLPYCSREFIVPLNGDKLSKKDNEIHMVTTDSSGSTNNGVPASYMIEYAGALARQKIHFHAYVLPNTSSEEEIMDSFKKHYRNVLDFKYFHLHKPLEPKELVKEISKYDYGSMFDNPDIKDPSEIIQYKFAIGNKISTYLEAGIPFFYFEGFKYLDTLMKGYDLGLPYKDMKAIGNIKKVIKKLNYQKLEKNILKAREDFLLEKNFPRLEKFVQEVVNKKLNKKQREKEYG